MARPADVTHAVLVGHLDSGEIFNTGFWLQGFAPTTDAEANDYAAQLASTATTAVMPAALGSIMAGDSGWDSIRVYGYPTSGAPAAAIGEHAIVGGGGAAGDGGPLQVCLVATLKTASSTRSGRGRMYLPCDAKAAFAAHRVVSALVTQVTEHLVTWFDLINALTGGRQVSVVSATHGTVNPVLSVSADNKPDIQRRHANKQTATFTQVSVLS